jgi:3-methyl-2-oxobutanoate hydroxymethyltransferase
MADSFSLLLFADHYMPSNTKRITVPTFVGMKAAGQRIAMLTAYDYPTAMRLDAAGVDALLIGDTLGMVVQGHETTLPVSVDQMIYHAEMVARAVRHALVVIDMPFPTFHLGISRTIEIAGRMLKESRCQAVKLEGGAQQADVIGSLVGAGIPVMAHCGLRPQSVHVLGGYKVQRDEEGLLRDALAVEAAGAFAVVLECIPAGVATRISAQLKIPTIGIGAGAGCDGQVLVTHDLLGLTIGRTPRFVRKYADLGKATQDAAEAYSNDVRAGTFPGPDETLN